MTVFLNPVPRGIWRFGEAFDLSREVFLSMSPTNYHCFIVSGDMEFHPRFSFNKGKVLRAHADKIRAGLFLRLKGLSPEEVLRFQTFLATLKDVRTPSCHLGTLQALRQGLKIRIRGVDSDRLTPSEFLESIFGQGLVDQNGKQVDYDVYVLKDKSMDGIMEEVRFFERKFRWAYLASDLCYFFIRLFAPSKLIRES